MVQHYLNVDMVLQVSPFILYTQATIKSIKILYTIQPACLVLFYILNAQYEN